MNYLLQISKVGIVTFASTFMLSACNQQSDKDAHSASIEKVLQEVTEKKVEAQAKPEEKKPENVLATVNGVAVDKLTLQLHLKSNQSQGNKMNPEQALNDLINIEVLKQEAEKRGLGKRKDVIAEVQRLRATVLSTLLLRDVYSNAQISDEALTKEYELQMSKLPAHEYKLQYLFVKDEDKAKKALASVNKNKANFNYLKKKYSEDSNDETGAGDTGWITLNKVLPALAEAASELKEGETSSLVKTDTGWNILRLEKMRDFSKPSFESVLSQIENLLRQRHAESFLNDLRAKADVKKVEAVTATK